jgi:hypothetical protein
MTDWRADLCRASYAAFLAGDADGLVKLYDPNCEWNLGPLAVVGVGPLYRGHAGLRAMVPELAEAFEGFAPRIVELRLLGEQLLIRGDAIGKSRLMGIAAPAAPFGQVVAFSDRRILSVSQTEDPPPNWDEAQPLDERRRPSRHGHAQSA